MSKAPRVSSPIATISGQPSSSIPEADNSHRALWCLVEGKTTAFQVDIPVHANVGKLKKAIKLENNNDLGPYDAHTLVLLQVRKSETSPPFEADPLESLKNRWSLNPQTLLLNAFSHRGPIALTSWTNLPIMSWKDSQISPIR